MMESIYPQRGGIHEQVYLLKRELERRGVEAQIVAYSTRRAEERGKRLLWLRSLSPSFIKRIVKGGFDAIIAETAWISVPSIIASKALSAPCILHLHSVESKQDVGLTWVGKTLVTVYERVGKELCDVVLVPSENDRALISSEKAVVFPNVIDVEGFSKYKPAELKRPAVVFVGGMGYPPNREAAEFLIRVSRILGDKVNFYLVGPSPPPASPPVYTIGYVESTIPYVLSADVCVAPLKRGGGVKLKMLEYMMAGKPIIATKKAVEGIDGVVYVNAESEEEFAEKIVEVLEGRIKLDFEKNREIVMKRHSPQAAVDLLLDIIQKVKG
jgi:glycosyltransferase involved in cell wall biosynthesis